jgi:hypothetical protein
MTVDCATVRERKPDIPSSQHIDVFVVSCSALTASTCQSACSARDPLPWRSPDLEGFQRQVRRAESARASLPLLRQPHAHHRDLLARTTTKAPTNITAAEDQDRHVMMSPPPVHHLHHSRHPRCLSAATASARIRPTNNHRCPTPIRSRHPRIALLPSYPRQSHVQNRYLTAPHPNVLRPAVAPKHP